MLYISGPSTNPVLIPGGSIQGRMNGSFSPEIEHTVEFVKHLGHGESGLVWKGEMDRSLLEAARQPSPERTENPDNPNPKKVAIKKFQTDMDREIAFVQELLEEKPKGIPHLFGVLTGHSGEPHLVMKYCNQGSAFDFFNDHVNNKAACYRKIIELITVIHEFHEAGYAHRDIHEKNFLLHQRKRNGDIITFLTDFGHAAKLGDDKSKVPPLNHRPVFMLNSPITIHTLYMHCKANDDFTFYDEYLEKNAIKIDLYQLGMMLFRIATATEAPIQIGDTNQKQKLLVLTMCYRLVAPNFFEILTEHLETLYPKMNTSVIKVIASLLNPNPLMTLPEAITELERGIAKISDEEEASFFNLSC